MKPMSRTAALTLRGIQMLSPRSSPARLSSSPTMLFSGQKGSFLFERVSSYGHSKHDSMHTACMLCRRARKLDHWVLLGEV